MRTAAMTMAAMPARGAGRADAGRGGASCGGCRHFSRGAAQLEARLPGLASLGSAYGSVRAQDGICERRARYLAASSVCELFEAASAPAITTTTTSAITPDGEAL